MLVDYTHATVQGQLAVIPGSHNAKMALPRGFSEDPALMTIAVEVNAKPGTAILFHQGTLHTSTPNYRPYNRYIQHVRSLSFSLSLPPSIPPSLNPSLPPHR